MATHEVIVKFIKSKENERYSYRDLPERLRSVVSEDEWRKHVIDYCVTRGLPWESPARNVCDERHYYEHLLAEFRYDFVQDFADQCPLRGCLLRHSSTGPSTGPSTDSLGAFGVARSQNTEAPLPLPSRGVRVPGPSRLAVCVLSRHSRG
jgi:hypothetical protein